MYAGALKVGKENGKIQIMLLFLRSLGGMFTLGILTIITAAAFGNNLEQKNVDQIKSILRKAEPDYFPKSAEIRLFGRVANFKIYISELVWGNKRETKRLVVLSNDNKYLGNYGIDDLPKKIENNKIIFDVDPDIGNEIDLSKGIPEEIYIDGETLLFEKGKSSKRRGEAY